jgi:hypothetical protein
MKFHLGKLSVADIFLFFVIIFPENSKKESYQKKLQHNLQMMNKSQQAELIISDCLVTISNACTENQKYINLLRQEQAFLRKIVESQSGVIKLLTTRIKEFLLRFQIKLPQIM